MSLGLEDICMGGEEEAENTSHHTGSVLFTKPLDGVILFIKAVCKISGLIIGTPREKGQSTLACHALS